MGKLSKGKALLVGLLVGTGVGTYILISRGKVRVGAGGPKGSMSLAVTPTPPGGGGTTRRVKVTITVQATKGTTPIDLKGTCTVHDKTWNADVVTKNWNDKIYNLSTKSTYYFEFDGVAGHTYEITAKVVLKNNAGSTTLKSSKTISLPRPAVPPAGTISISATYS